MDSFVRRLAELREMSYNDYLQTDEWKEARKRALAFAGYRCQLCNSEGVLHVHHRTYERRGCERLDDTVVLCAGCHEKHHEKHHEKEIPPMPVLPPINRDSIPLPGENATDDELREFMERCRERARERERRILPKETW